LTVALNSARQAWRQFEMKHKPAAILDVRTPPGSYDINVTPDKRDVFLVGEATLLEQLKEALNQLWQSANSARTFTVNQVGLLSGPCLSLVLFH
jgi:DNA mismatch repair protein PMS2